MRKIQVWIPMSTELIEDQREAFKDNMGMYPEEFNQMLNEQLKEN